MRVLLGIIFGLLTALAIAGGAYLWLQMREKHQDYFTERRELETEIAGLQTELTDWDGKPQDAARMKVELDSLRDTLLALEPYLEELFSVNETLSKKPKLYLVDPHDAASWRFYPFQLTIEDERSKVDSFIQNLSVNLPLINYDHLDAEWKSNKVVVNLVGAVRFPAEED